MSTINFKKCDNCGTIRNANDLFCGNCGKPFDTSGENYPTPLLGQQQRPYTPTQPVFTHKSRRIYGIATAALVVMIIVAVAIGVQIGKGNTPGTTSNTQNNPSNIPSPHSSTPLANGNATSTVVVPTATPTPTVTPPATLTPTPTTLPQPGTVLWQANWSGGMNGWEGTSDWQAANGILTNNGQQGNSVSLAPYSPGDNGIADYAIEVQIQFLRYSQAGAFGGLDSFGILARSTDGQPQHGYLFAVCASAGIDDCGANTHEIYVSNGNQNFTEYPWQPNPGETHTYRVEVKGNVVRVLIDGRPFLKGTDNTYLSGGEIGLMSNLSQISVNSFKVFAL